MRKTLTTLAVAATLTFLGSGLAVAQTTPDSPRIRTHSTQAMNRDAARGPAHSDAMPSGTKARDTRAARSEKRAMRKKADAERCLALKGAEERKCLKQAKGSYAQAISDANGRGPGAGTTAAPPGGPVPALQTQSSSVNATGIAPSTTGPDRTPGRPAVPAMPAK